MKKFCLICVLLLFSAGASTVFGSNGDFDKALRYYHKKDYRHARTLLEKYISQVPDPAAYYMLGYANYKLKKYDVANKNFSEAYLIDPTFSPKALHLPDKDEAGKK